MTMRYTTFQDVFIGKEIGAGINIEFTYTRLDDNRWHVVAYMVSGHSQAEIYTSTDYASTSLEDLFALHRTAVYDVLTSLASLVAIKGA